SRLAPRAQPSPTRRRTARMRSGSSSVAARSRGPCSKPPAWRREMTVIGTATPRLDGPAQVTGHARYGSDPLLSHAAYAVLVTSAIARGDITDIDERETRAVRGVLDVVTYRNVGKIEPGKTFDQQGYMGTSIAPLASAEIHHDGQIVALVVAESFE